VVEVEILNGRRENLHRSLPVIFILPSSEKLVRQREEEVMTTFLEPLLREMESALIHGFEVCYNFPVELISPLFPPVSETRNSKVRAMLMYWTGDHPAQTKVAGFKLSGYSACRRHKNVVEKVVGNKVMYPDNRRQSHDPPLNRDIEDLYLEAQNVQRRSTSSRSRREICITTYSKLWRLYQICGFDLSFDTVYDSMHILPLNMFKSFVELLVTEGEAANVDQALDEISPYRPKRLGARWPLGCANRLSYWRAEEYQHFVLWCLPYYMEQVKHRVDNIRALHQELTTLEKQEIQRMYSLFEIAQILTEIARLFFSYTRSYGWNEDSMKKARTLLSSWHIKWEEYVGPNSSILQHVAGMSTSKHMFIIGW
jgi:hypothetical protein